MRNPPSAGNSPQGSLLQWTPGALTATGTSSTFVLTANDFNNIVVGLSCASVSGTSPTFDLYLQTLGPDGNWYDCYHWAQQTANTTANTQLFANISNGDGASTAIGSVGNKTVGANALGVPLLSTAVRFAYTITGTTPSITPTVNVYAPGADRGGF